MKRLFFIASFIRMELESDDPSPSHKKWGFFLLVDLYILRSDVSMTLAVTWVEDTDLEINPHVPMPTLCLSVSAYFFVEWKTSWVHYSDWVNSRNVPDRKWERENALVLHLGGGRTVDCSLLHIWKNQLSLDEDFFYLGSNEGGGGRAVVLSSPGEKAGLQQAHWVTRCIGTTFE